MYRCQSNTLSLSTRSFLAVPAGTVIDGVPETPGAVADAKPEASSRLVAVTLGGVIALATLANAESEGVARYAGEVHGPAYGGTSG